MNPDWAIVLIIAFVSFPFACGYMASRISQDSRSYRWLLRSSIFFGVLGIAPAIWLNYPTPQIKIVAPYAGIILVACFAALGAIVGAVIDRLHDRSKIAESA